MLNLRGFIVVLLATAAIVALALSAARADDHTHSRINSEYTDSRIKHDHAAMGEAGRFYETWKMPDAPHVSCCNLNDCAPAMKARQDPMGIWHAQRESDGKWFAIPPEKVELNRDSPDGRSHLCVLADRVLCFVAGSGI